MAIKKLEGENREKKHGDLFTTIPASYLRDLSSYKMSGRYHMELPERPTGRRGWREGDSREGESEVRLYTEEKVPKTQDVLTGVLSGILRGDLSSSS